MALEYIDICLGEALERLDEAGGELVKYKNEIQKDEKVEVKELLNAVTNSIVELWKAREILYERKPDLKQNFKKEFDKNPQRYEELSEISQTAQRLEKDGKFKEASEIYEKLLEVSDLSHFVLVAQAGLYRCKKQRSS